MHQFNSVVNTVTPWVVGSYKQVWVGVFEACCQQKLQSKGKRLIIVTTLWCHGDSNGFYTTTPFNNRKLELKFLTLQLIILPQPVSTSMTLCWAQWCFDKVSVVILFKNCYLEFQMKVNCTRVFSWQSQLRVTSPGNLDGRWSY